MLVVTGSAPAIPTSESKGAFASWAVVIRPRVLSLPCMGMSQIEFQPCWKDRSEAFLCSRPVSTTTESPSCRAGPLDSSSPEDSGGGSLRGSNAVPKRWRSRPSGASSARNAQRRSYQQIVGSSPEGCVNIFSSSSRC